MDCGSQTGRSKKKNGGGRRERWQKDKATTTGKRKSGEEKWRLFEGQDVQGGGAFLAWFVSTAQPLRDVVRLPLLMCNSASLWRWVGGCRCLRLRVRGDWWFTEERWLVIHLQELRQSLWQHEWPVICHQTQGPSLLDTHSLLLFLKHLPSPHSSTSTS